MNGWQGVQASGARIPSLEARIVELEADNAHLKQREEALVAGYGKMTRNWRSCRDRIAGLEAEADKWQAVALAGWPSARAERAEARLAAVIALCDDSDQGYDWSCFVSDVRAAATGDPT